MAGDWEGIVGGGLTLRVLQLSVQPILLQGGKHRAARRCLSMYAPCGATFEGEAGQAMHRVRSDRTIHA